MRKPVVVVGASAAGLYTAARLAESGTPVVVLERAATLLAERTLIATDRLVRFLGPAAEAACVNRITRFDLVAGAWRTTIELDAPDLVVDRRLVAEQLAGRAAAAGADIRLGARFVGLDESADGRVLLRVRGQRPIETSVVVAADGVSSRVALAAGWMRQPTVSLVQARVDLGRGMEPGASRVWFRPRYTPYFFWLIPDGPATGVVGVIARRAAGARQVLDAFLDEIGLEPRAYQAGLIPRYARWRRIHRRVGGADVYLVGDAAGHVKVSTVGGLVTGFAGAEAVSRTILDDGGRRQLRSLRRELARHRFVRRLLHSFSDADYSRLVSRVSSESAQRVLAAIGRDDSGRLLRSLVTTHPLLALEAARAGLAAARGRRRQPGTVVQPAARPPAIAARTEAPSRSS